MYMYESLSLSIYIYIHMWLLLRARTCMLVCLAVHLVRSNCNARNAIPSQSVSFNTTCLIITSARESL